MKLTEAEMKMVFQIESTDQSAVLNELHIIRRYASDQSTKQTAENLLNKLRPLSDQACMDLIREVQAAYHLPGNHGVGAFHAGNPAHDRP